MRECERMRENVRECENVRDRKERMGENVRGMERHRCTKRWMNREKQRRKTEGRDIDIDKEMKEVIYIYLLCLLIVRRMRTIGTSIFFSFLFCLLVH